MEISAWKQSGGVRWAELEHTADFGLALRAENPGEIYLVAPGILAGIICPGPPGAQTWRRVEITAPDRAELLVRLLNEVLYLLEAETLLCVAARDCRLGDGCLNLELGLCPARGLEFAAHIKAVTYHRAEFRETSPGIFRAQVFCDV